MKRSALRTFPGLLAALLFSATAEAQVFRAYLSSTGSDANPCTLAAPCRLLPAALAAVASGGEIWMLDSANYNAAMVDVAKSVTILAIPGEVGSLVAQGGLPAIAIQTPGLDVKLRNLVLVNNPNDPGSHGIFMDVGGNLTVERCLIADMTFAGIVVSGPPNLSVSNSVIRNAVIGMSVAGGASVDVSSVHFSGMSSHGVLALASGAGTATRVTVSDSEFTNTDSGVSARTSSGTASVRITVTRSSVTMGTFGVSSQVEAAGGVASVSVSNSLLAGLDFAFRQLGAGAVVESFGNNTVRNNFFNVSGTLTPVPPM